MESTYMCNKPGGTAATNWWICEGNFMVAHWTAGAGCKQQCTVGAGYCT